MNRKLSTVIVTLVAALALVLAGCSKGADLTKVKAQAFEQVGKYGPQVSGLLGKLRDLIARTKALPPELPGVADVEQGLRGDQATIARLKGLLDGYAVSIEGAARSGRKVEVEKVINAFSGDVETGLAEAKGGLEAAGKKLDELEAAQKAAAAAAAVDAGVPLDAGAAEKGAGK